MKRVSWLFSVPASIAAAIIGGAYALTPLRERLSIRELAGDDCFVTVNNYELHYTDTGPDDAPPVVLLHGFGAWSFTWRNQQAALRNTGYRVIAIDQIGYGASSRPKGPVYTTRTQAELMLGALDALGIRQAHLVGHSFGGRVAMQMAIIAPERVHSLALIDPEAFATERPPIAQWLKVPLLGYALAFYSTATSLVPAGLRFVTKQHAWLNDKAAQGYAAPTRVKGTAAAQVWQGRSSKDGAQPVPQYLHTITQPTLIVWGGDDPVFPLSDGHKLAGILPHSSLHIVENAGHLPHEEVPDEVTAALVAFLKSM